MGRHFAGHGFLSAFARYSSESDPVGYVGNAKLGAGFCSFIKSFRPESSPRYIVAAKAGALRQVGCLFTPSPINAAQTWQREMHGPRSWSLCGVNHTLSSARAMDALTALLSAAVQPWDAIVCTSTASRAVIETLFPRQEDHLSRRLGASRFVRPQLPVIPLGVDCDAQARRSERKEEARSSLAIEPGDFVVLFLGRLSFHAKANPTPMYLALERLARRHRVVLFECGWTANDQIAQAFAEASAKLCPSVRSIVLDGRVDEVRARAWAAADVFCSLSDNIQETFGLTPIEAMAAGLSVVVTDLDGYKDAVRNGIDGFAIPTMAAPPGAGQHLAARHALEVDSYDSYIGQASTAVAVGVDATAAAFERLAADPDLCRRMGANGAARARERFDWKVIVRAYEDLWQELAALKNSGQAAPSPEAMRGFWPARPDPFELFASFPSLPFSTQHIVSQVAGIGETEVLERLSLRVSLVNAVPEVSSTSLLALWKLAGGQGKTIRDVLAAHRNASAALTVRALLWLAKLGLLTITLRQERP
ncbi:glycosyltransferase family 4 protein [Microvirga sp. BT688]|uniref:glycosyltransferase family 4 protein n=1 Tax=Microvirga sp. TaxID=1873136 RepID=UPI001688B1BC|nr:glycosyltransferase family 4 protein [Microvirga sp.]MBD2748770.1 glycosyltransferase family 4 protein [Microvirga sp.]